jgi:hypothetical protein
VKQKKGVFYLRERFESPFWNPATAGLDETVGSRSPTHHEFGQPYRQLRLNPSRPMIHLLTRPRSLLL